MDTVQYLMIIMWSVNANESIKYNKKLDSQCYLQVSFQILFENLLSQETFENMMRWFWFGCKSSQNNAFLNNAAKVLISILSQGATHGGQCLSIMNCHFDHERVLWNAVRTKNLRDVTTAYALQNRRLAQQNICLKNNPEFQAINNRCCYTVSNIITS